MLQSRVSSAFEIYRSDSLMGSIKWRSGGTAWLTSPLMQPR